MPELNQNMDIRNKLIEEISSNRPKLYEMLKKVEKFREKIDEFLPFEQSSEKVDFRSKNYNKFSMQENMKHVTEILRAELDIHKTIEGSIKNEFELRNKIMSKEDDNVDGTFEDIRSKLKSLDPQSSKNLAELAKIVYSKD